jgi:hypothetical protein
MTGLDRTVARIRFSPPLEATNNKNTALMGITGGMSVMR